MWINKKEYSINLDNLEIYFKWNKIIKEKYSFQEKINESNTVNWYLNYTDIKTGEILELQYKIITFKNYSLWFTFSFVYNWHIIDAFNVAFWDDAREIKTRSKITIYASFMVVYWNEFIYNMIEDIFITKKLQELRRIDIACDIPENKQKFIKHFKWNPTTELNFNKDKNEFETYYFWSRKNKKILIRIYDKILDTFKKNKQFLYDFKSSDNLTRFEIEFWFVEINNINHRLEEKKKLTYKNILLDKKILKDLFFSRAIKYSTFFSDKEFKEYKIKYIAPKIIDLREHYLEFKKLPKWWKQNAIWTSKKLIETIWINEFLKLAYDDFEDLEKMQKLIDFINRHIKAKNKIKISKKIKHTKNRPLDLKYKIEFIEKIIDYIINNNNIVSDEVYLELEHTIYKFEKNN